MERIDLDIKVLGKENTFVRCSLSFNKSKYNHFTGREKKKGYQLTCTPIEKGENSVTFTAFSGFYQIILEAERVSKARTKQATDLLYENLKNSLNYFTVEYGYTYDMKEVEELIENYHKK